LIEVQKHDFKRLGVIGDWQNLYRRWPIRPKRRSSAKSANSDQWRVLPGSAGAWSVVEQTALAEAEVEYYDHR
jgi:isoleucyl-tRNA synthetase